MKIQGAVLGAAQTNCYWLKDEERREAMVVDPGMNPRQVLADLAGYKITLILLTHGHWDHIAGVAEVKEQSGAPVWISEIERDWLTDPELNRSRYWPQLFPQPIAGPAPDRLLREGDTFHFGGQEFHTLHVPGHTPGSLAFVFGQTCLAGDTLFRGSVGRTDLPGGSFAQLEQAIRTKLYSLPDNTAVLCGHGPTTTIGREKRSNPFVREA